MEFSWTITAVALAINFGWMLFMFVAQQADKNLPSRHSIIPGTNQKFLYFQDFWTMTWGDAGGVGLILVAFAHLCYYRFGPYLWLTFSVLAGVFMVQFLVMCLGKNHKPDMGFPAIGKISLIGILHLPYYGCAMSAAILSLWLFTMPGSVLAIYIVGVVFYLMCFVLELRSGNFDPLMSEA